MQWRRHVLHSGLGMLICVCSWAIAYGKCMGPPCLCLSSAVEKMRAMGQALARARDRHYDTAEIVKKLRAMVHGAEEQVGIMGGPPYRRAKGT